MDTRIAEASRQLPTSAHLAKVVQPKVASDRDATIVLGAVVSYRQLAVQQSRYDMYMSRIRQMDAATVESALFRLTMDGEDTSWLDENTDADLDNLLSIIGN